MMLQKAFNGKRVLVTGHTGFKGSWMSQWLIGMGADVMGYSSYIPSSPGLFEVLKLEGRMKDVRGDVRDLSALKRAIRDFQPEVAFHMAAQPIVRTSYDDPVTTFDTNIMGTVNFLEALRGVDSVRAAVVVTSDKCYENVEWEFGYRETDPMGGKDPYSASKGCAELVFSSYWRSFFSATRLRAASARAGNVIGGGDWAKDRIVPDCMRAWSAKTPAKVRNPQSTRPWQHVLEPLSGYLHLAAKLMEDAPGTNGEAFNFGPPSDVNQPVSTLIEAMSHYWEGRLGWQLEGAGSNAKPEAGLLKLNCDKALLRMAWRPALSFEETARMTSHWYQAYYRGNEDMIRFTDSQIEEFVRVAHNKKVPWALSGNLG